MCNLRSLTRQCGTRETPGIKAELYFAPISEFTSWPQTRADLVVAPALPLPGDTKVLDEPFAWTAEVGKGFWRKAPILVDTGNLQNVTEGEVGGLMQKQRVTGFIQNDTAEVQEFVDCMVANSGCIVMAVVAKGSNDYHIVGTLEDPCFLEVSEGSRETRVGYNMTWMANPGETTPIYDAAEHGFKTTPNA